MGAVDEKGAAMAVVRGEQPVGETRPAGGAQGADGVQDASGARRVIARLNLPFSLEERGRPEREHIVGWNGRLAGAYLEALRRELAANAGEFCDCRMAAVRLDGGIATNAPAQDVCQTVRLLRDLYQMEEGAPVTARASICNVSGASMPYLHRAGVTRFDFELLALDSADFVRLNHADAIQDFGYVIDSFLHAYANKTLGIVLAYGFDAPGTAAFRRSIVQFTRMPASHLVLEPWRGACVGAASDDLAAAQLGEAREVLATAGFAEYAPLKFARPGDEDAYWELEAAGCDTLGFGLDATTRFDGVASTNTGDWDIYLAHAGDYAQITARVERADR